MTDGTGPIREKFNLWREASKGFKSRFSNKHKDPVVEREDLPQIQVQDKLERGGRLQSLRLKHYPSVDVDHERVYAGEMDGSLDEAADKLSEIGFRNNPTAYVEVTEENGPDDGSYSLLHITETEAMLDLPRIQNYPSFYRRVKDQFHVVLWELPEKVVFGAHKERHAWLQPARHVAVNDSDAEAGVRDFRDMWYETHGEELGGKNKVNWPTTH